MHWGVATSAYQIEGARFADGKGVSIWDTFFDRGGVPGDTIEACDHYNRLQEDLDLLAHLGVDSYRFSIAWTRVLPDGIGDVNRPGLDFYDRLVDGLLERGITPWPTLYHWDLPQRLQDEGGWGNRRTVDAFAEYAGAAVEALGDRVTNWITHNEPWVAAFLGHLYGDFAPGLRSWDLALSAGHNILLSHGIATRVIKEADSEHRVGVAIDCRPARPASNSAEDREATTRFDGFRNRWFFDPVFGRGYPKDMLDVYESLGYIDGVPPSFVQPGDMDTIAIPIDFLGLNYYTTLPVRAGAEFRDDPEHPPGPHPDDGYTEMGWATDPQGLADYLVELHERYSAPALVVTENGASYSDGPDAEGRINDQRRIDYLEGHIEAVIAARKRGAPVTGYFVWSLLDNVEWTSGFDQRFGLVWVDHSTQQRIPKASYEWYRARLKQPPPSWR